MRALDLVFVVILVALVSFGVHSMQSRQDNPPSPQPSSASASTRAGQAAVPAFTLTDISGKPLQYSQAPGDIFVILSAKDCQECRERVPTKDVDAMKWVKANRPGVPVYNFVVYASDVEAKQFAAEFNPAEDRIFADPGGTVSVGKLGGSDGTCWMYIHDGNFLYRGPADLARLQKALAGS